MAELAFRRAERRDLPAIVAMLADDPLGAQRETLAHLAPYEAAFASIDANPDQVLVVAERDGEVVGTAQVTSFPSLSHQGMWRADIEAVRIRSDQRGSGLGSALIRWCIEAARARGCGMVQLTSNASRHDAHRFYTRLGFAQSNVGFKLKLDNTAGPA